MKPKPFSFSSLDTFKNCPKQYRHKYVLRDVKEERSVQMIEGENVHLAFQKRVEDGTPLPLHLHAHEPKMAALLAKDGIFWCEEKIALNKRREMCRWDDPDIWWRGIIDFRLVDRDDRRVFRRDVERAVRTPNAPAARNLQILHVLRRHQLLLADLVGISARIAQ